MSDLQLTIIRSPLNDDEQIAQTEPKINGHTIEQDNTNPSKRTRLEADNISEYALENPITERESYNQEALRVNTASSPETEGRLIVQFPASVLTRLFTYLDVKDIGSLMSLCQFGNRNLKNIFFTQADNVSDILYKCIFRNLSKQAQAFTLRYVDLNLPNKEMIIREKAQAILHEIYTGLHGDEAMTTGEQRTRDFRMRIIRQSLDEKCFDGDEFAFMRHVASFNDPIYQETTRNLVERYRALESFVRQFPQMARDGNFTDTQRSYNGNSAKVGFFPLLLIAHPEGIEKLSFCEVEFATLPPQIKDCVDIKELHVENLKSFPPEIGQLTSLTRLTAESLRCTSLPDEIVNLTKLTYINLVDPSGELAQDEDEPPEIMITFDSLTDSQKEWILTLQRNGCVIEMMNVPPQEEITDASA